jgi:hypothetical protein
MKLTIENVRVTNWSKEPLLTLNGRCQRKLGTAIRYSRQIVEDSIELLSKYEHAKIVAMADPKMAVDYFGTHDDLREALHKYFGLNLNAPGTPAVGTNLTDQMKVPTILAKFKQIRDGISGSFDIVVGSIHDGDDVKSGLKGAFKHLTHGGGIKGAWKHIKFIREGTEGWVNPGGDKQRIHLNTGVIEDYAEGKIARVIVHEASHKFANTDDVGLLDDGSDDSTGYKWDGLKFNAKGYVGLENNADSFAWGGRLIWKRKRRLHSGI